MKPSGGVAASYGGSVWNDLRVSWEWELYWTCRLAQ